MRDPYSPLATLIDKPRDQPGERKGAYCIVAHTTGSGAVIKARKRGIDPTEYLISYYSAPGNPAPTYLVGVGGEIIQFASEAEVMPHAGWRPWEMAAYLDGTWRQKWARDYLDDVVAARPNQYSWWDARWHGRRGFISPDDILAAAGTPAHLRRPNLCSIGVECEWSEVGVEGEQLCALAELILDIVRRRRLMLAKPPCPTLCGHEDVSPCRRVTSTGRPWDPGSHFDWEALGRALAG